MTHRPQRRRPSSALLSCLFCLLFASSLALGQTLVVISNEDGGRYKYGQAQLSGRLSNYPGIVPGSVTMVFEGCSSTIGTFIDSGGALSGTYCSSPIASPDRTGTGTINYDTGRWALNLEAGGFFENSQLLLDYTYDELLSYNPTNIELTVVAAPGGSVSPTGTQVCATGSVVNVSAVASNHWEFWRWTGSRVPVGEETNSVIDVVMDRTRILTANFRADKVANETPIWWLETFGMVACDATALGDQDRDGIPTWEEYRYGTDPTRQDSDGDGIDDLRELDEWHTDPSSSRSPVIVDDDAPDDPWPLNPEVSDPAEDGSIEHPYDAIEEGVDAALWHQADSGLTGTTVIVTGEDGGIYSSGHAQLSGRLGVQNVLPGSITIVFSGDSSTIGMVTDDGNGGISGMYSSSPIAAPDRAMTGTVNYATGLWVLNLQGGGFFDSAAAMQNYSYIWGSTNNVGKVVVRSENGGRYQVGQVMLSGSLATGNIEAGTVTMLFMGTSSLVGSVVDNGHGFLTGTYSSSPIAEPSSTMTGTIDYSSGLWTLNLEPGGFFENVSLLSDYVYFGAMPGTEYVCVTQAAGSMIAEVSNAVTGVIYHDSGIEPGSLSFSVNSTEWARDDAVGGLAGPYYEGTVDYESGLWSLTAKFGALMSFVTNMVIQYSCTNAPDCHHRRILARVVCVKDGYYAMTGNHSVMVTNNLLIRSKNGIAETIINTDGVGPAFVFNSNVTAATILEGFRIETAAAYGDQSGIVCDGGSPVIRDCRITDCGMYGVLCTNDAGPRIERLVIDANNSGIGCMAGSSPYIVNSVIADNVNIGDGGGLYVDTGSTPTLMNCTIAYNGAFGSGGGVASRGAPKFRNVVIWGNTASTGDSIHRFSGTVDIQNSDVEGDWAGMNINADPLFVGPSNYHLAAASPCIDSGTPAGAPGSDFDGVSRPLDGDNDGICAYDMGAYEFVHALADSDTDHLNDASELIAGTDPTNSTEFLCLLEPEVDGEGNTLLNWQSVRGRLYSISMTSNLLTGPWQYCPGATGLVGTGGSMVYTNWCGPDSARYYRLGVRPAD